MTGSILLCIRGFALGGLVGFFGCMVVTAHAVAHNTKGMRDTMRRNIAEAEKLDRAERVMESMLSELKAGKGE